MPERRCFMQTLSSSPTIPISESARTTALFEESQLQILQRTDRMFAWLMMFQWLAGTAAGLWISPTTWIGATRQVPLPSSWRWLEHAGWVIFEDAFLLISIQHGLRDMRQVAERQARLEALNESIEQRVRERTHDLQKEIQERIETQTKLEETHMQLLQV